MFTASLGASLLVSAGLSHISTLSLSPSLYFSIPSLIPLSPLTARAKGKLAPRELFGRYQQHLVYRDGVGDRERAEPDDEAGPQSVEVDGRRRDGGERDPPIQESGQSAPTARVNTEGVIGNGQY